MAAALRKESTTRGEHTCSTYDELCKRLPANVYRAWHEGDWETLAELRTRIAYLVEHDVSDQSHQEFDEEPWQAAPQSRENPTRDNPTYEAIARKIEEEEQYRAWLIKEANLSPLEADVTRLQLQDPPSTHAGDHFTDQEIANMLDHSLGSIKQVICQIHLPFRVQCP